MTRIKQRNPKPVVDFPGRDRCIKVVHNILRSVEFNFECEAEDGEILDNDLMMDLTLGDIARQVVDHPDFIMAVPGVRLKAEDESEAMQEGHGRPAGAEGSPSRPAQGPRERCSIWSAPIPCMPYDLHQAQQAAEADSHLF